MSVFAVPGTNDSVEFFGDIREIQVGAGSSVLNIQYLYSFWKQWIQQGNAQWLPAFRVLGGDPLGGDNLIAFYAFLQNGWRIRVPEDGSVPTLDTNSGILATEELDNPFISDNSTLITRQDPVNVQFLSSPTTNLIFDNINSTRNILENRVSPDVTCIKNTIEKTLSPATLSVLSPISFVEYENQTGITTVTCEVGTHNLEVGDRVHVTGIAMTCSGIGTTYDPTAVLFPEVQNDIGIYPNEDAYSQPYIFNVVGVPTTNQFTIQAGISTIQHYYTYGGIVSRLFVDLITDQINVGVNTIPATTSSLSELDKIQRNTNLIPALL